MQKQNYKDDQEALSRVARGDLVAYRFLFDRYFADLCNFLLIYLHSKELAEEVALEVFTFVWEKRSTLRLKSTFKAFLFAVAKNKAISLYRKEQKHLFAPEPAEHQMMREDEDPGYSLETVELRRIIGTAVARLPEKSRQVYQMAWEENLSYNEIAQQLGIAPKTVENHVGIALRKLREHLKPYYKQIFML